MDEYAEELMSRGASLVTLAKGNRGAVWTKACAAHGGFYLGTIGGAAALIADENIAESEVIDYPELGMGSSPPHPRRRSAGFPSSSTTRGNELYGKLAAAAMS